jgi:hypothetical protein
VNAVKGRRWCPWHNGTVPAAQAVVVGAQEPGSGAGRPAYACDACREKFGVIPLDRHPPGSTGAPLFLARELSTPER